MRINSSSALRCRISKCVQVFCLDPAAKLYGTHTVGEKLVLTESSAAVDGLTNQQFSGLSVEAKQLIEETVVSGSRTRNLREKLREGGIDEVLSYLDHVYGRGMDVSKATFLSLVQFCMKKKDVVAGRQVHALILMSKHEACGVLNDHLIRMFSACGSLRDANEVFCRVLKPSVYTWQAIISAHTNLGHCEQAIELYRKMGRLGMEANNYIYCAVFQACGRASALKHGKEIHDYMVQSRFKYNVFVGNSLVDMYAKCGNLAEARKAFDGLPDRDVVTWNSMIAGYVEHGLGKDGLTLYEAMQHESVVPNDVTFLCVLKACASTRALDEGMKVHDQIIRHGLAHKPFVGNSLVDMYAKCGNFGEARKVFDGLSQRDVVSWNAMMGGYAEHGLGKEALAVYVDMQSKEVAPNSVTFVFALKACASVRAVDEGRRIHSQICDCGLAQNVYIGSTLVDMYAKCGNMEEARKAFDGLSQRNVVTWNAMIAGYAEHGLVEEAFLVYEDMRHQGLMPDGVTIVCMLKACASIGALDKGLQIHKQIQSLEPTQDVFVGSALVGMYAKCGNLKEARSVFDGMLIRDVVSWTAMISGYVEHGRGKEALALYQDMLHEGLMPDRITVVCMLKACASIGALKEGTLMHSQMVDCGLAQDVFVGNTLVEMYAKCGNLEDARRVFDGLPHRDVSSWNAMIQVIAEQGLGKEALALHDEMQQKGLIPDSVAVVSLLKTCASMGALDEGTQLHRQIIKHGLAAADPFVGSTLVHMYAKCGNLEEARNVFDVMSTIRDVVSWNAMISGYAEHGLGKEALKLYENMQHEGVTPNRVTFISLLTACSHAGLVDEGSHLFRTMSQRFGITPDINHHTCIVDMYSRAGLLDKAEDIINNMHISHTDLTWMSILGACRTHKNVELGKRAFDVIVKMNPKHAAAHVLLSSIYAAAGMWDDRAELRKKMRSLNMKKAPGCTWIKVEKEVHMFVVNDAQHPQRKKIHAKLNQLANAIKHEFHEYEIDTGCILDDVPDEEKWKYSAFS